MTRGLVAMTAAEIWERDEARVAALAPEDALSVLTDALRRVQANEAKRIGVPFLDPCYHGCDPDWRALLFAHADLCRVLARKL